MKVANNNSDDSLLVACIVLLVVIGIGLVCFVVGSRSRRRRGYSAHKEKRRYRRYRRHGHKKQDHVATGCGEENGGNDCGDKDGKGVDETPEPSDFPLPPYPPPPGENGSGNIQPLHGAPEPRTYASIAQVQIFSQGQMVLASGNDLHPMFTSTGILLIAPSFMTGPKALFTYNPASFGYFPLANRYNGTGQEERAYLFVNLVTSRMDNGQPLPVNAALDIVMYESPLNIPFGPRSNLGTFYYTQP